MLTVYSTQGSPGASTTAMHLAANWASEGREVLLIEADPAGGSLSHNLGIQFTPGSASFVASGLTILSNHLIDHAQDVLFENLHVMPAPASPTGARGIFNTFAEFSEDLRTISENEMAVIIDGGRITADTAASALTTGAAGVVVVCRNNSQLSGLEHLRDALAASPGGDGPQGCAVTIGKSPMDPEEWQENYGLTFCGSIEIVADMATDLSAYLARSKRKSKKWRASLEQVGEKLYPFAQPPVSDRPRRTRPAASPETEPAEDAGQAAGAGAAAASDPSAAQDPAAYGEAPPTAPPEGFPAYSQPAPPMAPAAGAGYGQSHYLPPAPEPQPGYGESHYRRRRQAGPAYSACAMAPAAGAGYGQSPPACPRPQPGYGEAPPMAPPEGFPAYGQPAPPPYPPPTRRRSTRRTPTSSSRPPTNSRPLRPTRRRLRPTNSRSPGPTRRRSTRRTPTSSRSRPPTNSRSPAPTRPTRRISTRHPPTSSRSRPPTNSRSRLPTNSHSRPPTNSRLPTNSRPPNPSLRPTRQPSSSRRRHSLRQDRTCSPPARSGTGPSSCTARTPRT